MRKSVLVIIAVIVAVGIIAFVASHRPASTPPGTFAESEPGSSTTSNRPSRIIAKTNSSPPHPRPSGSSNATPSHARNPTPIQPAFANQITNWEERLDAIITAENISDADKARQMVEMFPRLAPDAQEEVAHHISNLTPDEN